MTSALPGFNAPAVGFEQPFELLLACHERVQRSLALLLRLIDHIDRHGHDARSRSAAIDVLRYFEIAAPLHHQDEELHVFPLLAAAGDAALVADVAGLRADHARMEALWAGLQPKLRAWSLDGATGAADAALRVQAAAFADLYAGHLRIEEGRVFPAARARADATALAAMSAEMQARRTAARSA